MAGSDSRNREAGTEAEAMEELSFIGLRPGPAQFIFLYNSGPLGWHRPQWLESLHVNH